MKLTAFANRNFKEMVRDKINLSFGLGFPLVLLVLLSLLNKNVPNDMFDIEKLSPGVSIFGLSFVALFSGMLIAKDRSQSFMMRMFTSPLKPSDFILGYTLPLLPLAIGQVLVCYIASFVFGMEFSLNILLAVVATIPISIVFIALGLLCGSVLTDKQVGSVCGALLTNVTAWLSGIWFPVDLLGKGFSKVAKCLPFYHAVEVSRAAIAGSYSDIMPHLWWVLGWAVLAVILAIVVFTRKINSDNN